MTPVELLLVLFGLVAVAVAALFVVRRRRQSMAAADVGLDDLPRCLDTLLRRGYDLGFVCFTLPGDQRFVEFSKYMRDRSEVGLTMDFPRASWAGPYYEEVKALLEARGVPYQVEVTPDGPVQEFIQVDVRRDLALGADLARGVFLQVFRVPEGVRLTAEFEHVSPLNRTVEL